MEYPALFGQVGSAHPAVSLPGFRWKLTLSCPNPGQSSNQLSTAIRCPWAFSYGWTKHIPPPFLRMPCTPAMTSLVALPVSHCSTSASFLKWAPKWTWLSICALTCVKQKGRITSLNQLAPLLLMQPSVLLAFFAARAHCWLMLSLLSSRTSSYFLQSCIPDCQLSTCTGAQGYST